MDLEKKIKDLESRIGLLEKGSKPKAQKKTRAPTTFNIFVKTQIEKLKKEHPEMPHKEAFRKATELWSKQKESNEST
jgi:hypothetical protein